MKNVERYKNVSSRAVCGIGRLMRPGDGVIVSLKKPYFIVVKKI